MKTSLTKKLSVVAFAVALSFGVTTPTVFADEPASHTDAKPFSTINKETKGKLSIHKYLKPEGVQEEKRATGEEMTPAPTSDPVEGVEFTVTLVKKDGATDLDLTTNQGWKDAEGIVKAFNAAGTAEEKKKAVTLDMTQTSKVKTSAAGLAEFPNLKPGLYLVEESSVAGAKVNSKEVTVLPSSPFLITVPMSKDGNAGTTEWNWDLHVYPKNTSVDVKKDVNDRKKNVGDEMEYTIRTAIPLVDGDKTLDKYTVIDPLDGEWVSIDSAQLANKVKVEVEGATPGVTLTNDVDYKIDYYDGATAQPPTDPKHKVVRVGFTTEGLQKLQQARKTGTADTKVKTTLTVKIDKMPTDGVIDNVAYLAPSSEYSDTPQPKPNDPPSPELPPIPGIPPTPGVPPVTPVTPPTPPVPSEKVTSKLGKVKIVKHKNSDTGTKLNGAEFELYYCSDMTQKLTVNTKNKFTTEGNGEVLIEGLHLSNHYNNSAQAGDGNVDDYCLLETKAPAGYEKSPEPIKFTLTDGADAAVVSLDLNVPNTPKNAGFNLPFTGGAGLFAATSAGLVILIAAAYAIISLKRREA